MNIKFSEHSYEWGHAFVIGGSVGEGDDRLRHAVKLLRDVSETPPTEEEKESMRAVLRKWFELAEQ